MSDFDWGGMISSVGNAAASVISASKGTYASYIQAADDYKNTQAALAERNTSTGFNANALMMPLLLVGGVFAAIFLIGNKKKRR